MESWIDEIFWWVCGGLSASDVALLTGNGNNGFGGNGDNAWWIILFLIFGWGRNGFGGGFGGNGGGIGENYVLATDFATIERKLDAVNSGICDATFALNNTVVNGFSGVQSALCQGFNGLNVAYLQGTNSLASQLANCLNRFFKAVKNRLQKVNTVGSIA